mgnify:CR=1 FL=1|jgi:hypothetical protein
MPRTNNSQSPRRFVNLFDDDQILNSIGDSCIEKTDPNILEKSTTGCSFIFGVLDQKVKAPAHTRNLFLSDMSGAAPLASCARPNQIVPSCVLFWPYPS